MLKQILFSIFILFYQFTHLQTNNTHLNFILILADDQGWNGTSVKMINDNDLSKSDFYETPNIERIAENGVIFSNAYAGCLLYTSPSPRDATLSRMPSSA